MVRHQLTTASVVTFDVSQAGGSPVSDATLLLRDAKGQFVGGGKVPSLGGAMTNVTN